MHNICVDCFAGNCKQQGRFVNRTLVSFMTDNQRKWYHCYQACNSSAFPHNSAFFFLLLYKTKQKTKQTNIHVCLALTVYNYNHVKLQQHGVTFKSKQSAFALSPSEVKQCTLIKSDALKTMLIHCSVLCIVETHYTLYILQMNLDSCTLLPAVIYMISLVQKLPIQEYLLFQ